MKTLELEETDLSRCAKEASSSSVLVLKNGKPLALVSNVEGLDAEQIELGSSSDFWKLIQRRRRQKAIPWEQAKTWIEARGARGGNRGGS
jgi:hypothetical protein